MAQIDQALVQDLPRLMALLPNESAYVSSDLGATDRWSTDPAMEPLRKTLLGPGLGWVQCLQAQVRQQYFDNLHVNISCDAHFFFLVFDCVCSVTRSVGKWRRTSRVVHCAMPPSA